MPSAVDRLIQRYGVERVTSVLRPFLTEKRVGRKTIVIYSDLQEELKKGFVRKGLNFELDGFRVVALNVTKLRTDNVDPRIYLKRLDQWQARVEKGGGEWQVINNLDNLDELMPS